MLRSLDDASVLDRYIAIKAQIAELQEELDALKAPLLYALMDEPEEKANYKGFQLEIRRQKRYSYPEQIQTMERELKEARDHARKTGLAVVEKDSAILVLRAAR